jgi:hypothetical protein
MDAFGQSRGIKHNRHGIRVIEALAFITTSLSERFEVQHRIHSLGDFLFV